MRWIKASERGPDINSCHERFFKLDGKKVDGCYVDLKGDGVLSFEFKVNGIYEIIEMKDWSRVEWLDESDPDPTPDKTMEDVINKYDPTYTGMKSAMSEWASIQTADLQKQLKEKEEAIRELVEGLEDALPYVHDVGLENEERVKTKSLIQKYKQ
jgi:hypothetical protein